MTARIYIMPVVGIIRPLDEAWMAQRRREQMAAAINDCCAPPRTRPYLVISDRTLCSPSAFADQVFAAADEILRERRTARAVSDIPFDI